jgi:hypothetical protein
MKSHLGFMEVLWGFVGVLHRQVAQSVVSKLLTLAAINYEEEIKVGS